MTKLKNDSISLYRKYPDQFERLQNEQKYEDVSLIIKNLEHYDVLFQRIGKHVGLSRKEAANAMQRGVSTMSDWRSKVYGPDFHEIGGTITYDISDLAHFLVFPDDQHIQK